MAAELNKISVESTVDAIVNHIIELIIAGTFRPGQRIPIETELAKHLGVGRNSVREAVKILSAYGILEIRRADGTYVCSEFSPRMLNPLLYGIILDRTPTHLMEVRDAIDTYVYKLAIRRATPEDIAALKVALDDLHRLLREEKPDPLAISEADFEFHRVVSLCAHNPILYQINAVITMMQKQVRYKAIQGLLKSGKAQFLYDSHQKSYDVICQHRDADITDLVRESMLYWGSFDDEEVSPSDMLLP